MCATSEHIFHYVALALHCDMDQHALAPYNLAGYESDSFVAQREMPASDSQHLL